MPSLTFSPIGASVTNLGDGDASPGTMANIAASDDTRMVSGSLAANEYPHTVLVPYDLSTLPANASSFGLVVGVEGHASTSAASWRTAFSTTMRGYLSGLIGDDQSPAAAAELPIGSGSEDTIEFGSSTNDWGVTWAQLKNASFRIAMQPQKRSNTGVIRIDYVSLTVHWVPAGVATGGLLLDLI